ncbi:MAG: phospholipid carrier-dependent glycosyltransferase, partial [Chloroflexota bacterium]
GYEYLTVNAYNPWALVGLDGNTALAWAMPYWQSDLVPLVAGVAAVTVGAALLVGGFLYGLVNLFLRDERRTILLTAIFLALAFFVLPTRVHERYLMPVFALLPLLAVTSRSWLAVLVALGVATFVNLHAVLTYDLWGTDNVLGLPLGEASRTPTFVVAAVLLVLGSFLFAGWRLWRGAAREQDGFERLSSAVEGTVVTTGATGALAIPLARTAGGGWPPTGPVTGGPMGGGPTAWDEPVRGPSALDWIAHRITPRPLRADRSATLVREPAGRLDRLDLLMVLLVFVSSMVLRGFRVDEPYDMYFDEVYHARTAMEFLQDWRYDDPHDIYEWTHPHLAKYAMALGIELFGDHRVTGESTLGVPVTSATIERPWREDDSDSTRHGDRLYVATGEDVRVYDLETRAQVAAIPFAATALALDDDDHLLYMAEPSGSVSSFDTTVLDALRDPPPDASLPGVPQSTPFAQAGPVATMAVVDESLVVVAPDGAVSSFDLATGALTGQATVEGAAALARFPDAQQLVARPSDVGDPAAVADALADDLGEDPATIEDRLRSDQEVVALAAWLDEATTTDVQAGIDDGTLEGLTLTPGPIVAVGGADGVTFLDAASLGTLRFVGTDEPVTGLARVDDGVESDTLDAAAGSEVQPIRDDWVKNEHNGPVEEGALDMPGPVTDVAFNDVADLVHVVEERDGAPTVYVIGVHGKSVFMDVPLPFAPAAVVMDTQPDRPDVDRTQLLALSADGRAASVDVGGNAFGYRLPGVLMGALTAVGIYLLARVLFRRRSVGLFAAALALAEGMLFANPRIAMNDAYVTGFLVLAAALFAPVWLGTWRRWWQVVLVVPLVGALLGLALASKWVAAYAIGGFVLLVLLRSSLGRVIALFGMIALTATLGALAVRPADVAEPHRNWPFLTVMLLLTLALAAAMVRRPVRLTRGEVLSAVGWLLLGGVLLVTGALVAGSSNATEGMLGGSRLLLAGGSLVAVASIVGLGSVLAGRMGHGPLADAAVAASPSVAAPADLTPGWLSPGRFVGVPWLLALGCLVAIPLVVYVISYAPWVALGNQYWKGFPADHTGQDIWGLTLQMYRYHDDLRVPHAASSPWWAWPLNLKPVWYYQDSFAGNTTGEIYDSGNLVVFWMSIPALVFAAIAGWRRRSLALTAIVLLFLAMWLPWARIDRATFQYHYYTAVPFLVIALAYLLAELWHGPARLAWLLARVGAALCILGPSLMWLARPVLCAAANTEATEAGRQVCGASVR